MKKIFDFKSDWFQYYQAALRNEIEEEDFTKKYLKAYIVESNYKSINSFVKDHPNVKIIKSKEKNFFNVKYERDKFLYLDTENNRFWVIHSLEPQEKVQPKIIDIFCNSYLQDKIYIPNQMMEYYWKNLSKKSLGVSLRFRYLRTEEYDDEHEYDKESSKSIEEEIDNYSLRMWLRRSNQMDYIIQNFKNVGLPINFSFLNYAFYNEENELLMKENFHKDGKFTIIKGFDLIKHIDFIKKVREDYSSKLNLIEDFRIDWKKEKGDLIKIMFNKEINPKRLYHIINSNESIFRMIIIPLFKEKDYYFFDCLDTHTGGRFSLQVFNQFLYVNLKPDSCGNLVFRLVSNLQNHISPEASIEIDNQKIKLLN